MNFDLLAGKIPEIIAVALAILYLVLAVKQNIGCWIAWILSSVLYLFIMYKAGLYMEASLQIFYIVMGFYVGWNTVRLSKTLLHFPILLLWISPNAARVAQMAVFHVYESVALLVLDRSIAMQNYTSIDFQSKRIEKCNIGASLCAHRTEKRFGYHREGTVFSASKLLPRFCKSPTFLAFVAICEEVSWST